MHADQSSVKYRSEQVIEMLRGGDRVIIRSVQPNDAQMARTIVEGLSPRSRRFRFMDTLLSPSDSLIRQLTVIDPLTEAAFVAVIDDGQRNHEVGVGRFSAATGTSECEFAVVVADAWRRKGLGTLLMHHLVEAARAMGLHCMYSSDTSNNDLMRKFAAHLRLEHYTDPDDATQVLYSLKLAPAGAPVS